MPTTSGLRDSLLSEALWHPLCTVIKSNWTENNKRDFSAVKVTSEALCLPTQPAASATPRGTLSMQPSAAFLCGGGGLCFSVEHS